MKSRMTWIVCLFLRSKQWPANLDTNQVYYRIPGRELDDGLVLLTSDEDVVRMVEVLLGHTLVVLYTVSFADAGVEVGASEGEGEGEDDAESGDEEMRMKVINDPYW
jgi:hypothetical protein